MTTTSFEITSKIFFQPQTPFNYLTSKGSAFLKHFHPRKFFVKHVTTDVDLFRRLMIQSYTTVLRQIRASTAATTRKDLDGAWQPSTNNKSANKFKLSPLPRTKKFQVSKIYFRGKNLLAIKVYHNLYFLHSTSPREPLNSCSL